jgi:hypothetical protein
MPEQFDYQSPTHMPGSTPTCATAALSSRPAVPWNKSWGLIFRRLQIWIEDIAARIEANLSHVACTSGKPLSLFLDRGNNTPCSHARHRLGHIVNDHAQ